MRHIKLNNLFSERQYGFKSGRSTVLQLVYVADEGTDIIDRGGCVDAANLDFMQAFDTVPHRRLIHKLEVHI